MNTKETVKIGVAHSAKEVARTAVFISAAIGAQYTLSAVPFVEIVTLLFICYSYVFGAARGAIAAVGFAFLRQLLFGFFPVILILYLVYFPLLSLVFGSLGKQKKYSGGKLLILAVVLAVVCTACFTLLDNVLTPLYYAYSQKAARMYFMASLPFMIGQSVCAAISVGLLFFPLTKVLFFVKKA